MAYTLYTYFKNKYPNDEKIDEEYCDELAYYPNTKEYIDFIKDLRCLLNDRKISNWTGEEKEICNVFNTPEDKNKQCCCNGSYCNNIFWIIHGLWESRLYPGNDCLPQQLLTDFKEIIDNNDITRLGTLFSKYTEMKQTEFHQVFGFDHIEITNKKLIEENKKLIEENIKLVEIEDCRKTVQQWLVNNSSELNFKIGKALYDILK